MRSPELDHVVIVRDGRPGALVTRRHFYERMAGPFGYPELRKQPAALIVPDWEALASALDQEPPPDAHAVVRDERGQGPAATRAAALANLGDCDCPQVEVDPRWAALDVLRLSADE